MNRISTESKFGTAPRLQDVRELILAASENVARKLSPQGGDNSDGVVVSVFAQVRAVRTVASGSLSSVRNGGEGWGEEALRHGETVRHSGAPLSPALSPFVPHGERETDALLVAAVAARTFATIDTRRTLNVNRRSDNHPRNMKPPQNSFTRRNFLSVARAPVTP